VDITAIRKFADVLTQANVTMGLFGFFFGVFMFG
jgi:hypothetical protein